MPTHLAFVPQASRKKRSAAHKLFRPRNTSHAKRFTTAIKKIRAWQRANAKQLKIISGAFASAHSHFCRHAFHYFFNCFRSAYCHALCTSDASFLRTSVISSLHNLCLHGIRPAEMFCGGKVVAGLCLLFVLALCLASSPRNPRTLARARVVLTLISVVVMFT